MFGRAVSIITVISTVAVHALLLPPGADVTDLTNPIVNPKARSIQLPCSGCAFRSRTDPEAGLERDDQIWIHKNYEVNFSFGVSSDGERLELNGEPIYPPRFHREAYFLGHSLYVNQISPAGEVTPLQVTSSGLRVESEYDVSDDGDAIVILKFQILALEMQQVAELPEVTIDLLKLSNGELFIVTVDRMPKSDYLTLPVIPSESASPSSSKTCSILPDSLCKVKNRLLDSIVGIWRSKFGSIRPCPDSNGWTSNLPLRARPPFSAENGFKAYDGYRDRSHTTFHPHGHRRHHAHAFARALIAILIPILAGITVGLLASFLGLLFGRLVLILWRKFVRRGRRGNASARQNEEDFEDAKDLRGEEDFDPLPAYENVPAYHQVGGEPI